MPGDLIACQSGYETAIKFRDRFDSVTLVPSETPWQTFRLPGLICVSVLNPGDLKEPWEGTVRLASPAGFRFRYILLACETFEAARAGVEMAPIYKERALNVVFTGNPHHSGLYAIGLLEKAVKMYRPKKT